MSNMKTWVSVDKCLPIDGITVLTVGYCPSGWTMPLPASYYNGKFIMALNFQSERFTQIAIETFPTHWMPMVEMPEESRDWKLNQVKNKGIK